MDLRVGSMKIGAQQHQVDQGKKPNGLQKRTFQVLIQSQDPDIQAVYKAYKETDRESTLPKRKLKDLTDNPPLKKRVVAPYPYARC